MTEPTRTPKADSIFFCLGLLTLLGTWGAGMSDRCDASLHSLSSVHYLKYHHPVRLHYLEKKLCYYDIIVHDITVFSYPLFLLKTPETIWHYRYFTATHELLISVWFMHNICS